MLNMPRKPVTLGAHLNGRTQKHGDEHVPMMDFKLSMLLTEKQTIALTGESHVVEAWFKTTDGKYSEPLLKNWAPYRMNAKFKDSLCTLTVGVNAKEIDMGNCTIKWCVFEPQDKGSTSLNCTVQAAATSKTIEVLLWLGQDIDAKLQFGEMATDDAQEKLDLEAPGDDDGDEDGEGDEEAPAQARAPRNGEGAVVN